LVYKILDLILLLSNLLLFCIKIMLELDLILILIRNNINSPFEF